MSEGNQIQRLDFLGMPPLTTATFLRSALFAGSFWSARGLLYLRGWIITPSRLMMAGLVSSLQEKQA